MSVFSQKTTRNGHHKHTYQIKINQIIETQLLNRHNIILGPKFCFQLNLNVCSNTNTSSIKDFAKKDHWRTSDFLDSVESRRWFTASLSASSGPRSMDGGCTISSAWSPVSNDTFLTLHVKNKKLQHKKRLCHILWNIIYSITHYIIYNLPAVTSVSPYVIIFHFPFWRSSSDALRNLCSTDFPPSVKLMNILQNSRLISCS